MNRIALGLAVGVGYILGRTKKAKFAFAVATFVAGRRTQLSVQGISGLVGDLVSEQIAANPQFKEVSDKLKDMGANAADGLLTRTLDGLADRIADRTDTVRDHIADDLGRPRPSEEPLDEDEDEDEAYEDEESHEDDEDEVDDDEVDDDESYDDEVDDDEEEGARYARR
ncbi:hypothetical protein [Streptomyces tsukubensis]|uniref:DNA primase n=1 Tax=Streptomyces tsukubensis TaxID=83656 RepID=A0A1V4AE39_9ACTN|nr:hypothetical protein [Streptomyces tsukubensis]OON81753.1 hypothetical protein B1H18_06410 [Streptomyces tsukubensis]QFR96534.1 hypothetical protein GBW32_30270 [Streptomyces tsukubensis]